MKFALCLMLLTGCTATLVCEADVKGEVVETREVQGCQAYEYGVNYRREAQRTCAQNLGVDRCRCHWEGADECGEQLD